MNEFVLTIFICSVLSGKCVIPDYGEYKYPKTYLKLSACVKSGLGEVHEVMYNGRISIENIDKYELYPRFTCIKQKIILPKPKPKTSTTPGVNT
tara:strand:+ start:45 stop:326 length:282 start_codon:yes stop_codon:yes gene_type:complete